jgi:RNA polymerase sigma factor (sigma-70 family)
MGYTTKTKQQPHGDRLDPQTHPEALLVYLEGALAAARPRLLRLARRQGVSADAADDVVQETSIEAWRHIDRLHTPEGIDAWLTSICHHVCLRWIRAECASSLRHTRLPTDAPENGDFELWQERELPDPLAFDPAEELNHQDLTNLLDHALHLLPTGTRQAIELCYLAELPQREVALRLGLTINTLEVRLHRARQQLRQALCGELRADAEAFGLALDQDVSLGWRETRQWCHLCGQYRLRGLFELQAEGRVHLRLRCPECSPRSCDMFASSQVSVAGLHSFRSAYKHAWKVDFTYWKQALEQGQQLCLRCKKQVVPLQIVRPDELAFDTPYANTYRTILDCPTCGITGTCSIADLLVDPSVSSFIDVHPRWLIGPESVSEYAGQPVIRTSLRDRTSAARLTVLAQRQSLQILATFPE